jgi:hypothetical protein
MKKIHKIQDELNETKEKLSIFHKDDEGLK